MTHSYHIAKGGNDKIILFYNNPTILNFKSDRNFSGCFPCCIKNLHTRIYMCLNLRHFHARNTRYKYPQFVSKMSISENN